MDTATVQGIIQQIEQLSDEAQLVLSLQLVQREESEWRREAEAARRTAGEKGITQYAIDKAVDAIRSGK